MMITGGKQIPIKMKVAIYNSMYSLNGKSFEDSVLVYFSFFIHIQSEKP